MAEFVVGQKVTRGGFREQGTGQNSMKGKLVDALISNLSPAGGRRRTA